MTNEITFDRRLEMSGRIGIEYWRGLLPPNEPCLNSSSVLIFPRKASRFSVSLKNANSEIVVTSSQMLFLPSNKGHSKLLLSPHGEVLTLFPTQQILDEMILENNIPTKRKMDLSKFFVCKLSRWMDDLIDRYRFERLQNHGSPKGCPSFLEKQIINEFARFLYADILQTTGEIIGESVETPLLKIMDWIEKNLFTEIDLEVLAAKLKISVSQINRIFLAETKQTPKSFIQNWKLEEAARLIERKDNSITDIAFICGYGDLSAFSRAFKKRFGLAPLNYPRSKTSG